MSRYISFRFFVVLAFLILSLASFILISPRFVFAQTPTPIIDLSDELPFDGASNFAESFLAVPLIKNSLFAIVGVGIGVLIMSMVRKLGGG